MQIIPDLFSTIEDRESRIVRFSFKARQLNIIVSRVIYQFERILAGSDPRRYQELGIRRHPNSLAPQLPSQGSGL